MSSNNAASLLTPPTTVQERTAQTIEARFFGGRDMARYRHAIQNAMALVQRRLARVEQPFTGIRPETLAERFESLDLDAPLGDLEAALAEVDGLYLEDAVYFHHPRYSAHLNCPVVLPAVAAELIQGSINTAVETWDQSGGATLIEQALIDWTRDRIGLGPAGDGVFTSGGTQSNLMGVLLARDHFCARCWGHDTRQSGLHPEAGKLRIFTSRISHFSVQKAAALLGLGYDAVVPVPCDDYFRMDPAALAGAIEQSRRAGNCPMAVVATAGTTDFGSIDPLPAVAELCREQGLWCHVDAAYGCGLLVSPRHRHRLAGIEAADSVTVDYHKAFFQPVSCSAFLVRDKQHMACLTHHADYLNPVAAWREGTPNLVDKSLQTTRRFDALKLWLTLRTLGPDALGQAFDRVLHLARRVYLLLLSEENIEVLHQPRLSTLVFRYRPTGVDEERLDALNAGIHKAIMRDGRAMIAATRVAGRQYLKFTFLNPATTIGEIKATLEEIKRHGGEA